MGHEPGGDCSHMTCPYEVAFVDRPNWEGEFRKYTECAGQGVCDRSTGQCECFDGYTGKACQRATCPNDCSGHGTCEYIEELTVGPVPQYYNEAKNRLGFQTKAPTMEHTISKMWDYHKLMACVCDAGYQEWDCSKKICPHGTDIMSERIDITDVFKYHIQNVTMFAAGPSGNGTGSSINEFYDQTFALTFRTILNETYTTVPIRIKEEADITTTEENLGNSIELALESLPMKVITNINVNVTFGYEARAGPIFNDLGDIAFLQFEIEYVGDEVQGDQSLIMVHTEKCEMGCTPQLTGLPLVTNMATLKYDQSQNVSFTAVKQYADYNSYECGRRGKCNFETGQCECFAGYFGEACTFQSELV